MSESKVLEGLFYTKDHEWVKIEGSTATVGISDHAQHLLTDVVFVELPDNDKDVKQGDAACVVESVKSVSDVYAPIGGTISEINEALEDSPESVNEDAYGEGWMFKLTNFNADETSSLMNAEAYKAFIENESH